MSRDTLVDRLSEWTTEISPSTVETCPLSWVVSWSTSEWEEEGVTSTRTQKGLYPKGVVNLSGLPTSFPRETKIDGGLSGSVPLH